MSFFGDRAARILRRSGFHGVRLSMFKSVVVSPRVLLPRLRCVVLMTLWMRLVPPPDCKTGVVMTNMK